MLVPIITAVRTKKIRFFSRDITITVHIKFNVKLRIEINCAFFQAVAEKISLSQFCGCSQIEQLY